jgi:hypothetical protein
MDSTTRPQFAASSRVDHVDRSSRPSRRRHRAPRRGVTATVVAVALAAGIVPAAPAAAHGVTASGSPVAGDVHARGGCTVRPTEDPLSLTTPLLEAWRVRDGVSEILHDVHCTDGRVDRVWIGSDIIPANGSSASPLGAPPPFASPPPPLNCDPIACAAAYIGVPATTLAVEIATEATRTGTIGTQVAISQLDAAMSRQLAVSDRSDPASLLFNWSILVIHDAIHDALLDQSVTALRGVLGG